MQAFRSEGEVERWCERQGRERGAILTPATLWRLAVAWYDDRLDRDWRRRDVAERQEILRSSSLEGRFWLLE